MTSSNYRETIRWAFKKKTTTFFIISGMSIGIAVTIIIGLWVMHENSFDKFHQNSERIYRTCRKLKMNNEEIILGSVFKPLGEEAKNKFPQIENICRVRSLPKAALKVCEKVISQDAIASVDPNFFQFFSYKLEVGEPEICLDAPDKVVIDRTIANTYFPNENAVGKVIKIFSKEFHVSAVMENMPENSHLKLRIVIPISSFSWVKESGWGNNDNFITYLLLQEGTDTKSLSQEIKAMVYKLFPIYKKFEIIYFLQPLTDIHFSQGFRFNNLITSDRRMVFTFITIAVLILLIACFNFINLFISTSFLRANSIGIKKINGCSKSRLFLSSFLETGTHVLVSTVIAILLVVLFLPYFNQLSGSQLSLNFTSFRIYLYLGILFFFTILTAGIFPVLYILRFNPYDIMRSQFKGEGVTILQRSLVISQFVAAIMLISMACIIQKQISYIRNKDLGFNKDQIIYVFPGNMAKSYSTIRNELKKDPNVIEVTAKNCLPNDWNEGTNVEIADNPSVSKLTEICAIKQNYIDVMQMELENGINPFVEGNNHYSACLINEQAANSFGFADPVGKQIIKEGEKYTIAGVLKDINTKSLHNKVDPQIYIYLDELRSENPILIRTNGQHEKVIKSLKKLWKQYNPDIPFEYHFLNDEYDKLYKTELSASNVISTGMVIALILAFMGLYAISHYATEKRIKEIGIRKVNGAKIGEILALLNRDFIKWVIIAYVIATPVAYYAMTKWLENFAYKTELSWWIFALAGVVALGIALLTVSWQSWKAATRNPVEALRYE